MEKALVSTQQEVSLPWLDHVSRHLFVSGELSKMVQKNMIGGVISDLCVMERILFQEEGYDPFLKQLAGKGKTSIQILDHLLLEDLRLATAILLPVYKRSEGKYGFVSAALQPSSLQDPREMVDEAQRLCKAVKQPNLMIRIPATDSGLEAATRCVAEGIHVHISLVFSQERFHQAVDACFRGLETRVASGRKIQNVRSAIGFCLRQLDERMDRILEERAAQLKGKDKTAVRSLQGKIAVAVAQLVWEKYQERLSEGRFVALHRLGAHRPLLLWGGNPADGISYPKTLNHQEVSWIIDPSAFSQLLENKAGRSLSGAKVDKSIRVLEQLQEMEISLSGKERQWQEQEIHSLNAATDSLLTTLGERREAALVESRQIIRGYPWEDKLNQRMDAWSAEGFGKRLWAMDPTLWKADEPDHQEEIGRRLGWLRLPEWMHTQIDGINQFVEKVRRAGFTHALLCGMGGSALTPEVLRQTFDITKGYLDLTILDSTDPAAVLAAGARSNLENTLFIISSKSGSTLETSAFFQYFWEKLRTLKNMRAGENFVAITDPGTAMEQAARKCQFRHIFLNPPDMGGRYAALSYAGMVPAALMGINISRLLERARRMMMACGPRVVPLHNPAFFLGAMMGISALEGRDKITFILSEKIASLGPWMEQLLAESTGKEGLGVVPVEGEPPGNPDLYGKDRLFLYLRIGSKLDKYVNALIKTGHPVITLHLEDGYDLGAEFLRWEIATVAACRVLGVNPFDQPNVQEVKDLTREILTEHANKGRIPMSPNAMSPKDPAFPLALLKHLRSLKKGDFIALNAFFERNQRRIKLLQEIRVALRSMTKAATTAGFGPRFLHSTGQLHKGGPNTGVFLQFCAHDNMEAEVPGTYYTFDKLIAAQAMGDYATLTGRHRRILLIDLEKDVEGGLRRVLSLILNFKSEKKNGKK